MLQAHLGPNSSIIVRQRFLSTQTPRYSDHFRLIWNLLFCNVEAKNFFQNLTPNNRGDLKMRPSSDTTFLKGEVSNT